MYLSHTDVSPCAVHWWKIIQKTNRICSRDDKNRFSVDTWTYTSNSLLK